MTKMESVIGIPTIVKHGDKPYIDTHLVCRRLMNAARQTMAPRPSIDGRHVKHIEWIPKPYNY